MCSSILLKMALAIFKSRAILRLKNYLVMTKKTEQSTARNYLGSITQ